MPGIAAEWIKIQLSKIPKPKIRRCVHLSWVWDIHQYSRTLAAGMLVSWVSLAKAIELKAPFSLHSNEMKRIEKELRLRAEDWDGMNINTIWIYCVYSVECLYWKFAIIRILSHPTTIDYVEIHPDTSIDIHRHNMKRNERYKCDDIIS